MAIAARRARSAERDVRAALRARLEARRAEIESVALTRVCAIADPAATADPAYTEGLRGAVVAALEYGLASIELAEGRDLPIPVPLLAQARVAARNGIDLQTVLRRYLAGYSLLVYFMIEEASGENAIGGVELQRLLGSQAVVFDRLLAAVSEEHGREGEIGRLRSAAQHRVERVKRLLDGELLDPSQLNYELEGWHVGAIGLGSDARDAIARIAAMFDCSVLLASPEEQLAWAWFGTRHKIAADRIVRAASEATTQARIAVGEPGEGIGGWRLTHRQAQAVLPLAGRGGRAGVRYAEVGLLAALSRDEVARRSLCQLYLTPLERGPDGGETLREALRAYFAAGCNVSSAATAIGLSRRTVANRVRSAEERIGRPLAECAGEVETALRLQELNTRMAETEACSE